MNTVEVIFRTDGNGNIVPGKPAVERVISTDRRGSELWVKTETGDIWPVQPHKQPARATYFALGR